MKANLDPLLKLNRVPLPGYVAQGRNGAFVVRCPAGGRYLNLIASDGGGWDPVSVSIAGDPEAVPSWKEMVWAKDLFWDPEEAVMQSGALWAPPRSQWVNLHPGTLHLWKPQHAPIPLPPQEYV